MRGFALFALLASVAGCRSLLGLDHPSRADADVGGDGPAFDAPALDPDAMPDAVPPDTIDPCPGYVKIGQQSTRYRYVSATQSWTSAVADCANDGTYTHLAVIANDAELVDVTTLANGRHVWIGLSDRTNEGTYRWVTNEDTGAYPGTSGPPWDTNQPSQGAGEDCVLSRSNAAFNDRNCGDTESYVCECDAFANQPANYAGGD